MLTPHLYTIPVRERIQIIHTTTLAAIAEVVIQALSHVPVAPDSTNIQIHLCINSVEWHTIRRITKSDTEIQVEKAFSKEVEKLLDIEPEKGPVSYSGCVYQPAHSVITFFFAHS